MIRTSMRRIRWAGYGRSVVVAAALLALSHSAFAAESFKQRVGALTKTVDDITEQAESLTEAIAPGRGVLSEEMAVLRYEDALYSYVLGSHEEAAEALFSLVASGVLVDSGLHEEAEWYLAESLRLMGNVETAIGQYQSIAANTGHAYREYAVRRLLQAYAETCLLYTSDAADE